MIIFCLFLSYLGRSKEEVEANAIILFKLFLFLFMWFGFDLWDTLRPVTCTFLYSCLCASCMCSRLGMEAIKKFPLPARQTMYRQWVGQPAIHGTFYHWFLMAWLAMCVASTAGYLSESRSPPYHYSNIYVWNMTEMTMVQESLFTDCFFH